MNADGVSDFLYIWYNKYMDKNGVFHIAMRNGFSEARPFVEVFSKQYGMTPFRYRKERKY